MLNEFVYCPRLCHLEHVQREFEPNAFTVEGDGVHQRVVREETPLQLGDDAPKVARSVSLTSEVLGLTGVIDLVEQEDGQVVPVDYKRGKAPKLPAGAYEPELVQLCSYGLMLREQGLSCERGVLYFAGSKTRVEVPFDEALITRTLTAIREAKASLTQRALPPPLVNSPKCVGCSLSGICLPDETNLLLSRTDDVRPMWSAKNAGLPLYVQGQGFRVGVSHDCLEVKDRDGAKVATARLGDTAHVTVFGNVQLSTQAMAALLEREIPAVFVSSGGWLRGVLDGLGHGNIGLRREQFRCADDAARCLVFARSLVKNKIQNQRTLVRRGGADDRALRALAELAEQVDATSSLESLLGVEGTAARTYFEAYRALLDTPLAGDFSSRNRRPPKDPINAALSFAAVLLTNECVVAAKTVGLDPLLGLYHQAQHGRPSLALDLMEPFRPLIAESVVLTAFNSRALDERDFIGGATGVTLTPEGRKALMRVYERRLAEEVQHPVFGYSVSYRRVIVMHARLFARWLTRELPTPPEFKTR